MNILKIWKDKIIFGFYNPPAEIWEEMEDAGFSVRLFADGTLIYQSYSLDRKLKPSIKKSGRLILNDDTVGKITRILAGYTKEIEALPEYTNNGSNGGSFYDFVFCGKYVSSINIQRTDALDIMRENPERYEKYHFDMADENIILDIFTKITAALRDDGVMLYLHHLIIGSNNIY